jgi:hypothetical protein
MVLDCARRTSTALPCAFREQKGLSGRSLLPLHPNIYGETLRVLLSPGRSASGPCRDGEVEEVAIQAGQIATV